jgi:sugar phosphate isomerase/epimerase
MQTTRRQFIKSGAGCALGMTLGQTLSLAATGPKPLPIGYQLYTVRAEFSRRAPETIKAIAQIGYQGVEFWDYAGTPNVWQSYSPRDMRKILDDCGLKCCGMHAKLEALAGDKLQRTIETNKVLGNEYINLVMAPDKMKSESGITELAKLLNDASVQCRAQKTVVGYHCHGFDFARIGGRFAWELLFKQLSPEVNMQLDVGNCLGGGGDPIAMLKEFPGRSWTVHIKEYNDKTFDSDYYKEVFKLCETISGTKWYIVEMGSEDGSGFDVPRQALAKLHAVGK